MIFVFIPSSNSFLIKLNNSIVSEVYFSMLRSFIHLFYFRLLQSTAPEKVFKVAILELPGKYKKIYS